jgi:mRNA interferase HigB
LFPLWEHAKLTHAGHRSKRACQLLGQAPGSKVSLERWHAIVRAAQWTSTDEVQKAAPKAKVLNRERVRFEVAGGNYRLVAAFDFRRQIAFVKFIGTHAEYDRIDAMNVSQF